MSYSVRPHRQQPTMLPRPWDSPGKNTGVGCHFLLQCLKVKSERGVPQSHPTLCNPMVYTVHGILQATILEWVAFPFLQGFFPIQGLNPGLPHCGRILYQLSHKGSPRILEWIAYPFSSRSFWPALQVDSLQLSYQGRLVSAEKSTNLEISLMFC